MPPDQPTGYELLRQALHRELDQIRLEIKENEKRRSEGHHELYKKIEDAVSNRRKEYLTMLEWSPYRKAIWWLFTAAVGGSAAIVVTLARSIWR